jgi:hypothetical protein
VDPVHAQIAVRVYVARAPIVQLEKFGVMHFGRFLKLGIFVPKVLAIFLLGIFVPKFFGNF